VTSSSIWTRRPSIEELDALTRGSLPEHIGIRFVEVGDDFIRATMPVDARTRQPYGLLHGGASVALAETLGSVAGHCCMRPGATGVVGLEINANHVRGVRDGLVTGTARPVHAGGSTQVWEIRIENEAGQLVCVSRLTLSVLTREPAR
jgi:1,4-dihydroxy-2-naphthoyl-CoA hydrolase